MRRGRTGMMTDEIRAIGSSAHVLHRRFQSRSLPRDRFCALEDHGCARDDDDDDGSSAEDARAFYPVSPTRFLRRARERVTKVRETDRRRARDCFFDRR